MQVNDPGKLLLLTVALIGAFVGIVSGTMTESAGVGIIGGVVGYLTGNGRLIATGRPPVPALAPKHQPADPTPDPAPEAG